LYQTIILQKKEGYNEHILYIIIYVLYVFIYIFIYTLYYYVFIYSYMENFLLIKDSTPALLTKFFRMFSVPNVLGFEIVVYRILTDEVTVSC